MILCNIQSCLVCFGKDDSHFLRFERDLTKINDNLHLMSNFLFKNKCDLLNERSKIISLKVLYGYS